jgi:hypothetical protein
MNAVKQKRLCIMNLADILDFIDDPSKFTLTVDGHEVKFQDEYGLSCGSNAEFFVAGHEFDATVLIHAIGFDSAWGAWIDECETIQESELPEAYGVPDSGEMHAWRTANGHLCGEEWSKAYDAEGARILRAWADAADVGEREHPDLIEGYEYQSNASGTGIVNVGQYAWMNEADLSEVDVTRKEENK